VVRLEVARIARAHGLRGDVVVVPITNRTERFARGAVLWDGDVERTIATSRAQGDRFVVHFAGVDDRTTAEGLRGHVLTADPMPSSDPDEVFVHELIGRRVLDQHGRDLGVVRHVEANPAHDIVVCDSGVLVPMVFVRRAEPDTEVVHVDVPDGLVELYSEP
jgi:16S rRNA processing protein RimM